MKHKFLLVTVIALLLLTSCSQDPSEQFNSDSVMYQHMVQVWAASLEPYSYSTAFIGDSRVIGADWVSAFDDYDVVNLGIGGDKVEDVLSRLILLDVLEVENCFVSIGGNNALSDRFDTEKFTQVYNTLLTELESRNMKVFVNTIAPITAFNGLGDKAIDRKNANIEAANRVIKDLAQIHEITVIDIAPLMAGDDGRLKQEYTIDGVHHTPQANQLWFDTVRPYMESLQN